MLAGARLAAGQPDVALRDLAETLQHVRATEVRVWEAEIHRLTGEARLAIGDPEAERALLAALTVAREQGARSFELRPAISLARHRARTPKHDDALLDELGSWAHARAPS